jgi:hypothetical protein
MAKRSDIEVFDISETDVIFKYHVIAVMILSRRDLDSPPVLVGFVLLNL